MVNIQVCRSSGIALISATAAGALAGERKNRAVFDAFHSVAFTNAPLMPRVGWSEYTGRLIQKSASKKSGVARKLLRSSSFVELLGTPFVCCSAKIGSKR